MRSYEASVLVLRVLISKVFPEQVVICEAFRGRTDESRLNNEESFDVNETPPLKPWGCAFSWLSSSGAGNGSVGSTDGIFRGLLSIWRFGAGSKGVFSSSESSRRKPGFPRGRASASVCGVARLFAAEGELVGYTTGEESRDILTI
ncbi:hypothetical protein RRF57_012547 [Xylaria bambusicola]|uniref:Uncharacterized protein n=1 Tax=Xylaria bambusicola TaxID=326684 RepID=A0AAN7V0P4_9PEZI